MTWYERWSCAPRLVFGKKWRASPASIHSRATRQWNWSDERCAKAAAMKSEKPSLRLASSAAPDRMGGLDDNARFANVVMPHIDDAYRLAHWLTGNRTDAEDVVQDASLRAFRAIRGYAGGSARAWLLSIVRNTAYSWLRKNRPTAVVTVDDLEAIAGQSSPSGSGDARDNAPCPGRRRSAPRRNCGAAGTVPGNAGVARHRGPGLPRNCSDDRSADRHRHVATRKGTSPADRKARWKEPGVSGACGSKRNVSQRE
jgi:RNA polymerase sigma factor (sigma-70 family)